MHRQRVKSIKKEKLSVNILSLFLVSLTLEHKATVKRCVSHQFLNPLTGDQPVARPQPTQDNTNTE
jgi:hypothetical protein